LKQWYKEEELTHTTADVEKPKTIETRTKPGKEHKASVRGGDSKEVQEREEAGGERGGIQQV
jgi:hypothetical protein